MSTIERQLFVEDNLKASAYMQRAVKLRQESQDCFHLQKSPLGFVLTVFLVAVHTLATSNS